MPSTVRSRVLTWEHITRETFQNTQTLDLHSGPIESESLGPRPTCIEKVYGDSSACPELRGSAKEHGVNGARP